MATGIIPCVEPPRQLEGGGQEPARTPQTWWCRSKESIHLGYERYESWAAPEPASTAGILLKLVQSRTRSSCLYMVPKDSARRSSQKADDNRGIEDKIFSMRVWACKRRRIKRAEQEIIKHMQEEAFKEEINWRTNPHIMKSKKRTQDLGSGILKEPSTSSV